MFEKAQYRNHILGITTHYAFGTNLVMQKRKNAARFLRRLCTAFPLKSRMQYPFPVITKRFFSFCSKLFFSKIKNECKQRPPHRLRRRSVPLRGPVVSTCQGTPTASRPVSPWILFPPLPAVGMQQTLPKERLLPRKKVHQPCGQCTFFAYFPVMLLPYES